MNPPKNDRKACDFCYRRRIKCDAKKPECTQCVTYAMECSYGAPSRKARPKKRMKQSDSRFENLEAQIRSLDERLKASEQRPPSGITTGIRRPPDEETPLVPHVVPKGKRVSHVPSLQHVMPLLEQYLAEFNTVLPLFQDHRLRRLVRDFYDCTPAQRDPVVYAVINVVLALVYRYVLVDDSESSQAMDHLNAAQSVLSDVVLGETTLLNIQVLIGMVILLQGSPDHQPALILIATTMRLIHKLRLHDREASRGLTESIAGERRNVFWLAYILDKNISVLLSQPAIQLDDDIDLDLPQHDNSQSQFAGSTDEHGVITTVDGGVKFYYFRARIQLATIEGGVYDYLYSTRAQRRDAAARELALDSVARALWQWKASILPEFAASSAAQWVAPGTLHFLVSLHAAALHCTTLINHAHAWDTKWMSDLRISALNGVPPSLPLAWDDVVSDARGFLTLYEKTPVQDLSCFWINGCTYMTAMMVLTANIAHDGLAVWSLQDSNLVNLGIDRLNGLVEQTENKMLAGFRDTCLELKQSFTSQMVA